MSYTRNHTPSRPPAEGVLRITVTEMTTMIYAELAKCGYPVARPSPRAPRQLPPVPVATPSATSPPVNHDPIRPGRDMDTPATRAGRRGVSLGNDGARRSGPRVTHCAFTLSERISKRTVFIPPRRVNFRGFAATACCLAATLGSQVHWARITSPRLSAEDGRSAGPQTQVFRMTRSSSASCWLVLADRKAERDGLPRRA